MKDNRSSNARNAILNSINNLIESSSKNNPYDKTFIGRITSNNENNYYNVSINGKIYENIKGLPLFDFNVNDMVYCLAPQGNMNQLRIILCLNNTNLFNNINIKGTFTALDNIKGFSISDTTNVGLELGRQDGAGGTPYIDFHTDGNSSTDYNSRLIAISDFLNVIASGGLKVNGYNSESIVDLSLTQNGYIKYSSGLIIQWVNSQTATGSSSGQLITLPTSFTNNTSYAIIPVMKGTSKWGNAGANGIQIENVSGSQFRWFTYWTENYFSVEYIAIGY